MSFLFSIAPLQHPQLLDVKEEDLVLEGECRVHSFDPGRLTDYLPRIIKKRMGKIVLEQFVVQLNGCHLRCPYCYVTEAGYLVSENKIIRYTAEELVQIFLKQTEADIFHLMGGAPALYLKHWPELLDALPDNFIFHSDFTLTEGKYDKVILQEIARPNAIYAVNWKGMSLEEFEANTTVRPDPNLFYDNINLLVEAGVNFYCTFTNCDPVGIGNLIDRWEKGNKIPSSIWEDSFSIDLVQYDALTEINVDVSVL
ncbi:MAG TPA: radical SAM protein [bacterium]|nr:radical SAM protein [bacterium]